ncbi:MAG: tRNA (adenosine(37)-N6)-threonylcarbamoyltransferase complex ATPase subunit type 1 TsaE [Ruminiclostridium sp.]|nr:tRNA (adenosine(37)-N6)-threonylcarbamoyltransferase complex ATPase subunit type 1 TsaE [Ruminiclostridium sp.]
MQLIYNTNSPEETTGAAQEFASLLKAGDAVLYRGEMGAGKTYFTKGIARHFGYGDHVTSPTFTIVNEYDCTPPVFHFDLYRLADFDELYATGFFDYLDRGGILCVEWSENVPELEHELESVYIAEIEKTGENSRTITITRRE